MGRYVTAGEMQLLYLSNFLLLDGWMRGLRAERPAALAAGERGAGSGLSVPPA